MFKSRSSIIILFTFAFFTVTFADEYKLEWKFEKGAEFITKSTVKMQQTFKNNSQDSVLEQLITVYQENENKVTDVANDKFTITEKITKAKLSFKLNERSFEYDSDKDEPSDLDESDPIQKLVLDYVDLLGKSFSYKVDKFGKTSDLSTGEISESNPFFSLISESFDTTFMPLPDKKLKIGESWEEKIENNKGTYKSIIKRVFTLKDVKDKNVHISVSMSFEYDIPQETIKIKESKGEGELIFSLEENKITSGKISVKIIQDVADGRGGFINQNYEVETDYTLSKKK